MSDTVIRIENLGKKYIIGHQRERYVALRDVAANTARNLGHRLLSPFSRNGAAGDPTHEEFWALQDVSFEVKQGERLGIIGRNGAGKSTLLKILSRITEPTAGRVRLRGRVASLLEVGTGFHPELTGRENIYLNGAILGMTRSEIKRKFDEIVDFAEVEKFLDTPVKRYSSGMYVRLAFAVAAHLEPEILLVDEVLAVGDAEFQKKCLGKMNSVAQSGRTILFVSHNIGAIRALCTTALWLDKGGIKGYGDAQTVTVSYLSSTQKGGSTRTISRDQHIRGNGRVTIESVDLVDSQDVPKDTFLIGEPFEVRLSYQVNSGIEGTFWLFICLIENTVLLSSFQKDVSGPIPLIVDGTAHIQLQDISLLPGTYTLAAGIFDKANNMIDWVEDIIRLEILPQFYDGRPFDHRYGFMTKEARWQVEQPMIYE